MAEVTKELLMGNKGSDLNSVKDNFVNSLILCCR